MFVLCLAVLLSWFLPALAGYEVTPFYDWSMYALPQLPRDTFDVAEIRFTNGRSYRPPNALLDHRRMLITYTLPHYADMISRMDTGTYPSRAAALVNRVFRPTGRRALHNTADAIAAYPGWLKRYVRQQTGRELKDVLLHRCVYTPEFRVARIATTQLIP